MERAITKEDKDELEGAGARRIDPSRTVHAESGLCNSIFEPIGGWTYVAMFNRKITAMKA